MVPCTFYLVLLEDLRDETVYRRMDDIHLHGYLLLPSEQDDGVSEEVKLGHCEPLPKAWYDRMRAGDSSLENLCYLKERPWRYMLTQMNCALARQHISGTKAWIPKLAKFVRGWACSYRIIRIETQIVDESFIEDILYL